MGRQDPSTLGPWKETEGVKQELEAAGFRGVQAEYIDVCLPVEDADMFFNSFIRSLQGYNSVPSLLYPLPLYRQCTG